MASDKSTTRSAIHSPGNDRATGTSARREEPSPGDAQLSSPDGVDTGVSSIALSASFSGGLDAPRGSLALGAMETDGDAEVMLRVKAGDEDAFGHLV
jgi:hypothetical protein